MGFWSSLISVILPPRCALTGEIVDSPGMISAEAWSRLTFIAPPCCDLCGVPFDIDDHREDMGVENKSYLQCASCLTNPPHYNHARSSIIYDDQSRDLILAFKHGDQTHLTVTFTPWLTTLYNQQSWKADYIIPVPLHWTRLFKRRYNQSAILAQHISHVIKIPVLFTALKRNRRTKTQGHLSPKDREKNVKNAFYISNKHIIDIQNKHILLIDDVLTTGATVNECARILKEAGAQTVKILTIARAVRGDMAA